MDDTLARLVQPQTHWHIMSLTPANKEQVITEQTADLLICDHLSAHCSDMRALLSDWVKVIKPGGWLAIQDTVVPGSRLRGKKANLQRRAGDYINMVLRWGDGGNGRNLCQDEWLDILRIVNMIYIQHEISRHEIEFTHWLSNTNLTPGNRIRLRALLRQTPEPVAAFLTPKTANDRITFFLTELTLVGRLEIDKA